MTNSQANLSEYYEGSTQYAEETAGVKCPHPHPTRTDIHIRQKIGEKPSVTIASWKRKFSEETVNKLLRKNGN